MHENVACEIFLTTFCNLRCKYCIAGEMPRLHMDSKTGRKVVDFFMDLSEGAKSIDYSFTGGEPLIRFPLMKEIVLYAKRKGKEKNIVTTFTVKTNGTILNPEILSFLKRHSVNVFVSIDGNSESHNKYRKNYKHSETHKKVKNNLLKLIENGVPSVASLTIHPDRIKYAPDDIRFLCSLGANNIDIGPAYGTVKWNKKKSLAVSKMFLKVADILKEIKENDLPIMITPLYSETEHRGDKLKNCWGCGSTTSNLAFMPDGQISGCSALAMIATKYPQVIIGDIFSGINEESLVNLQSFCQAGIESRKKCQNCNTADNCNGGCVAMNLSQYGQPLKIPDFYCNIISVIPEVWKTVWGKEKRNLQKNI
jgi:uncharacterized protein